VRSRSEQVSQAEKSRPGEVEGRRQRSFSVNVQTTTESDARTHLLIDEEAGEPTVGPTAPAPEPLAGLVHADVADGERDAERRQRPEEVLLDMGVRSREAQRAVSTASRIWAASQRRSSRAGGLRKERTRLETALPWRLGDGGCLARSTAPHISKRQLFTELSGADD
jgi:hypothetical protein